MSNFERGFTLIEVLVSGFILFLVIASMTLIYRGALLSSSKAERALSFTAAIPSIRLIVSDSVRTEFSGPEREGQGKFGGLQFKWKATLTHRGKPSVILQEDSLRELRYFLWHVRLVVETDNLTHEYEFSEVSW